MSTEEIGNTAIAAPKEDLKKRLTVQLRVKSTLISGKETLSQQQLVRLLRNPLRDLDKILHPEVLKKF